MSKVKAACLLLCAISYLTGVRAKAGENTESTRSTRQIYWLINQPALQNLIDAGLSDDLAHHFFDNKRTFLMHSKNVGITSSQRLACTPTQVFPSYRAFEQALSADAVSNSTGAILYDNEMWPFTPDEEKMAPALYEQKFAALVHEHGLMFISAPATNIVNATRPESQRKYDAYLELGIAREAARHSDIFEIQAQGSEMAVNKFKDFVAQAARQARQANPEVKVLVGLSTAPNGQVVTSEQLYQAAKSVIDLADGFWLNIPSKSPYCPRCSQKPRADLAVEFLKRLNEGGF